MEYLKRTVNILLLTGLLFTSSFSLLGQADSLSVRAFRDKAIPYIDLGGNTTPFTFSYRDSAGSDTQLEYRNNVRAIFGVGFSYKWFSLRVAANLPKHLEDVNTSGKTSYRDIVLEFKMKRLFFDVGLHNYRGFFIKDAYQWDSTLTLSAPNLIAPKINTLSLTLNNWWFTNSNIDMSALKGKRSMYLKQQKSFYLKSLLNFQGISNNGAALIPSLRQNPELPITGATTLSSLDIGVLPGFVYVNRFRNWQ